jgi:hypothetical protein
VDLTIFWRLLAILSAAFPAAWTARMRRFRRTQDASQCELADPGADTIPIAPADLELVRNSSPEDSDTVVSDATELLVALREGSATANARDR